MIKVLIVGAGAQGGPCASILAGEDNISEIRLGDINLDVAQKVAHKIGDSRIRPFRLDASKKGGVFRAADGVDVALPAVVGAKFCLNEEAESGVISPDSLNPQHFFEGMAERGVPFEIDEQVIKHTVVKKRKSN